MLAASEVVRTSVAMGVCVVGSLVLPQHPFARFATFALGLYVGSEVFMRLDKGRAVVRANARLDRQQGPH